MTAKSQAASEAQIFTQTPLHSQDLAGFAFMTRSSRLDKATKIRGKLLRISGFEQRACGLTEGAGPSRRPDPLRLTSAHPALHPRLRVSAGKNAASHGAKVEVGADFHF